MSTLLTSAAVCVAWLMGASEIVLPDRYIADAPGPNFCAASGRPDCTGVFFVMGGRTHIVALPGDFDVLAHELAHAQQRAQGRPLDEAEAEAVQARVGECFQGEGHL